MATRAEIEQQLQLLPQPPFHAQLTDGRQHLTDYQRFMAPHVADHYLFVIAEVVVDRCFEQPGIWGRAINTRVSPLRLGQAPWPVNSIWLNLEWCIIDRSFFSVN